MGICFGSPTKIDHFVSDKSFGTNVASSNANHGLNSRLGDDLPLSSNLKSFSFHDLSNATKNFSPDGLIGEGGFGFVYKGWINDNSLGRSKAGSGTVVAVKKLKAKSFQGHREWLVKCLGELRHQNLVKLIGYCLESDQRLLVYEFMPRGSLENHLFKKGGQPMAWSTRMQIAIDIARGLSYLHNLDANIIYRDLKASNILIDSKFHAKLSDFGLARNGPSGDGTHVSTRVVGTMGYAAPEYIASGHLTTKNDVYSFGVVLLELMSGRRTLGDERIEGRWLVDWAMQFIGNGCKQFSRIMDTRLRGEYSKKGAQAASLLAQRCLSGDPRDRPTMLEVLQDLQQHQALEISPQAKLEHRIHTLESHELR